GGGPTGGPAPPPPPARAPPAPPRPVPVRAASPPATAMPVAVPTMATVPTAPAMTCRSGGGNDGDCSERRRAQTQHQDSSRLVSLWSDPDCRRETVQHLGLVPCGRWARSIGKGSHYIDLRALTAAAR